MLLLSFPPLGQTYASFPLSVLGECVLVSWAALAGGGNQPMADSWNSVIFKDPSNLS